MACCLAAAFWSCPDVFTVVGPERDNRFDLWKWQCNQATMKPFIFVGKDALQKFPMMSDGESDTDA